jgi:hypothetical protein
MLRVLRLRWRWWWPASRGLSSILGGLEFIDSSGVAALARGRKLARHAGV